MILSRRAVPKKMKNAGRRLPPRPRRRRHAEMAVVSLLALAGVAMLSDSISDFGINLSFDTSLGHQRRLSADSTSASSGRSEMQSFGPGIANTVHKLAAPFLEDQANIFVFDETDTRPVINTFFAIPEGQKIKKVDAEVLAVWKQAWSGAGWNPVSLARARPFYTYAQLFVLLPQARIIYMHIHI